MDLFIVLNFVDITEIQSWRLEEAMPNFIMLKITIKLYNSTLIRKICYILAIRVIQELDF